MDLQVKSMKELGPVVRTWIKNNCVVGACAVAVFLVGSTWFVLAAPTLEEAKSLKEQESFLQQRVIVLNNLALKQDAAYMEELRQRLNETESALPKKPDMTLIAQDITKLAEKQLLQVSALRLPKEGAAKHHPQLNVEFYPVQLELKGEYSNLVKFVHDVEQRYALQHLMLKGDRDGIIKAELKVLVAGEV